MVNIGTNVERYLSNRRDPSARYASFDHCFNHFRAAWSSGNPSQLSDGLGLQTSCLHLGFYLASWGMFRGSAQLLQNSSKALERAVQTIADAPATIWEADVHTYDETLVTELLEFGDELGACLPGGSSGTLVTKVMLGTFGCVPAIDRYFRLGFGTSGFNRKTLVRLREFHDDHELAIGMHRVRTIDFDGNTTDHSYTRAKVIDMVFFTEGLERSRR